MSYCCARCHKSPKNIWNTYMCGCPKIQPYIDGGFFFLFLDLLEYLYQTYKRIRCIILLSELLSYMQRQDGEAATCWACLVFHYSCSILMQSDSRCITKTYSHVKACFYIFCLVCAAYLKLLELLLVFLQCVGEFSSGSYRLSFFWSLLHLVNISLLIYAGSYRSPALTAEHVL